MSAGKIIKRAIYGDWSIEFEQASSGEVRIAKFSGNIKKAEVYVPKSVLIEIGKYLEALNAIEDIESRVR